MMHATCERKTRRHDAENGTNGFERIHHSRVKGLPWRTIITGRPLGV